MKGKITREELDQSLVTDLENINSQLNNKANKSYVSYEDFGAKGDGVTNDYQAIKNCHDYANNNNLEVKSNLKKYYLGICKEEIVVKTNWSGAEFIIDDTINGIDKNKHIFTIDSKKQIVNIPVTSSLVNAFKRTTKQVVELMGYGECVCEIINANKKIFIRKGINADNGVNHVDYVRIDNNGNLLDNIILDFNNVTSIKLYPIDEAPLIVEKLSFVTKANNEIPSGDYWKRGVNCTRSRVVFRDIKHEITHKDENSNPYDGFIRTYKCAYIVFDNIHLQPHKTCKQMGSYEIRNEATIHCVFNNVVSSDMLDETKWGCYTSNFCKNLIFNNCSLNRIDAHKGVSNLTLNDSELGVHGLTVVGWGDLILNNTKHYKSNDLVYLRDDYGSFWDGTVSINTSYYETSTTGNDISIINAKNDGSHDFGYLCKYPRVIINQLKIINRSTGKIYLTRNNNSDFGSGQYKFTGIEEETNFPYLFSDYIELRNISGNNIKFNLFSTPLGNVYALNKCYIVDGIVTHNIDINIENVQFEDKTQIDKKTEFTSNIFDRYFSLGNYHDKFKITPRISIRNTKKISISCGSNACIINVENTLINQANMIQNGNSRCNVNFINCLFNPMLREITTPLKQVSFNPLYSRFVNCDFLKPNVNIDDFSVTDLMEIYHFLKEIRIVTHFLEFNLRFNNCNIFSEFDFTQMAGLIDYKKSFGIDLDKCFGNFNFDKIPRCWGYDSERPSNNINLVPIGYNYYNRTNNSFTRWNGSEWV